MNGIPIGTWAGRYLKNERLHPVSVNFGARGIYDLSRDGRLVNSGTASFISEESIVIQDESGNALQIHHRNGTCRLEFDDVGTVVLRLDGQLSPSMRLARDRYPLSDISDLYGIVISYTNHYYCEIFHFTGALLVAASQWEDWPFRRLEYEDIAEAVCSIRPMGPNRAYSGSRYSGNEVVDLVDSVWETAIERNLEAIPKEDFLLAALEYPSAQNQRFLNDLGLDRSALFDYLNKRSESGEA